MEEGGGAASPPVDTKGGHAPHVKKKVFQASASWFQGGQAADAKGIVLKRVFAKFVCFSFR